MNKPNTTLEYPWGDQHPAPGTSLALAPGVHWVRMGLPFALDHINLWLLRDEMDGTPGWTVVDCGISDPTTQQHWTTLFDETMDGLPVLRVVVTHMHPDHIGLAHWLCDRWSTPERRCHLWVSATDHHAAWMGSTSTTGFGGPEAARFFASHGLQDPKALEGISERAGYYSSLVPAVPRHFVRLMDGMPLQIGAHTWTCIAGYGHAPEHMALSCPALGLLISGDMVLPTISTNVSVHEMEPEANPLAWFLASLERYQPLKANTLVLPSHGRPFRGLHHRIQQLKTHHQARLDEVLAACDTAPQHGVDLLPVMFKRPLDLHQTTFALGEVVAHLHHLWQDGHVQRQRGPDGIYRFVVPLSCAG
ncbi:MAG: hypothetical protein RJA09_2545 [Pseudomonadota bacterium]